MEPVNSSPNERRRGGNQASGVAPLSKTPNGRNTLSSATRRPPRTNGAQVGRKRSSRALPYSETTSRTSSQHRRSYDDDYNSSDSFGSSLSIESDDGLDNDHEFTPRLALPDHKIQQQSISDLMHLLDSGTLDLDPAYGRDIVWSRDQMSGLINSLIENFYIPPFIFNSISEPSQKLVCVDGKQRLSAIRAFIDGTISCTDAHDRKWFFQVSESTKNSRRKVLPDRVKQAFLDKKLAYCEIADLATTEEEDLFSRAQRGIPLRKLKVRSGAWAILAKRFEQDFAEAVSLSDSKRGKRFQNILLCFAQILETENKTSESRSTICAASLDKFAQDDKQWTREREMRFVKVFTIFNEIAFHDPQTFESNGYERSKNFTTIEMVAVTVLIARCGDSLGNEDLLGSIRAMRQLASEKLQNLFSNQATWNVFWDFIRDIPMSETQRTADPETMEESHLEAAFLYDAVDTDGHVRLKREQKEKQDAVESGTGNVLIEVSDDELHRLEEDIEPSLGPATKEADGPPSGLRKSPVNRPQKRKISDTDEEPTPKRRSTLNVPTSSIINSINNSAPGLNEAGNELDRESTSSGYSTHSETRGRVYPTTRRWRAQIPSNSRAATVPNSTSPIPDPATGDGTMEIDARVRTSISSPDPLRDDADDTIRAAVRSALGYQPTPYEPVLTEARPSTANGQPQQLVPTHSFAPRVNAEPLSVGGPSKELDSDSIDLEELIKNPTYKPRKRIVIDQVNTRAGELAELRRKVREEQRQQASEERARQVEKEPESQN